MEATEPPPSVADGVEHHLDPRSVTVDRLGGWIVFGGFALAQLGRRAEAIPNYERYARAVPEDAEAAAELRQLKMGR